ncbi:MAG TPA: polysaccharide deacetylase family protein [Terriglobales bacterium]
MLGSFVKEMIATGLHRSGGLKIAGVISRSYELNADHALRLRRNSGPRFVILCYHRIGVGGIPFYSNLPTSRFEQQMRYLRRNCRLISLDQLLQEMGQPGSSETAVAVTFDDGYLGTYTDAFPILRKYEIPATVYLTAGCIETGEVAWYDRIFLALQAMIKKSCEVRIPHYRRFELDSYESRLSAAVELIRYLRTLPNDRRLEECASLEKIVRLPQGELKNRMMNWDQIRQMQRAGIRFEAHTMTHPVLSRLDAVSLNAELAESKRLIEERIQSEVKHFAYPFGKSEECGEATGAALLRLGFRSAVTTISGVNTPMVHPYRLRRVQMGDDVSLSMFAFRLARLMLQPDLGEGYLDPLVTHNMTLREEEQSREAKHA